MLYGEHQGHVGGTVGSAMGGLGGDWGGIGWKGGSGDRGRYLSFRIFKGQHKNRFLPCFRKGSKN